MIDNTYILFGTESFTEQSLRVPPTEFLVVKFGKTEYTKNNEPGEYEFTEADADKLISEFKKKGRDIVIDFEHQSLSGNKAPAAGWINDLVKTSDGVVAKIKYWVEDTINLLKSGSYRYTSPVLYMSRRTPISLHSVAITNNPATINCPALVASEGSSDLGALDTEVVDRRVKLEDIVDFKVTSGIKCDTIFLSEDKNSWTIKYQGSYVKNTKPVLYSANKVAYINSEDAEQFIKIRIKEMDQLKQFAEALGVTVIELSDKQMDEVKTIEAVNAKIVEFKEAVATLSKEKTELLTLHEVADFGALTLKIKGLVPASDLAVLTDKLANIDAEKSVAKAFSDKKLVEAQREWAMSYAKTSPEGFKAFCEKCPAVAPAPANEVDVAKVVETAEVLEMTDESLGKKFDSDETVRNEFMDKASYVAFMKADSKGQIKICNGVVVE